MINRKKLRSLTDYEQVSPAFLMQSVIDSSPENITFDNKIHKASLKSSQNSMANIASQSKDSSSKGSALSEESSISMSSVKQTTFHSFQSHKSLKNQQVIKQQINRMKEDISGNQNKDNERHFMKNKILEEIVKRQKIKNLQLIFTNKIQRNSTNSPPVEYNRFLQWDKDSLLNLKGIQLPSFVYNFLYVLSVLQILTLTVIYSLSLVFDGIEGLGVSSLQRGSLVFYMMEIMLNLVSVKLKAGKKVEYLSQIFQLYLQNSLLIDLVSLLILFLDIFTNFSAISYLRLFILFKLPQCLQKIEKLQVYFNQNVYNQQYWELIKVFLFNFTYAHIIALFLAAMAHLNPTENWMIAKGIQDNPWTQQYIWSYYWANTIMLTIGFGDLVATNYQEAACLIFIETLSCVMIAYNVNCVGSIVSNIRYLDQQRCRKFKIFKKLTDNNTISDGLVFQITNYIEQSSKLRKKFNYEQDKDFLSWLPPALKSNYLREAHKQILSQLVFFRGLLDNTLSNFAEKIQMRISHPQEVIRTPEDDFNLIILRKGQIGYACKLSGSVFHDEIADLITVTGKDAPFLTSLDFISKQRPPYQIKSLSFSVLLNLAYEQFIEVFRQSDLDYELYCFLRDKIRNIPDEFEVLPCEFCGKFRHLKFSCPRLHYAPLSQNVLNKELHREKVGRNQRSRFDRIKAYQFTPLQFYANLKVQKQSIHIKGVRNRPQHDDHVSKSTRKRNYTPTELVGETITNQKLSILFAEKAAEIMSMELVRQQKKQMFFDEIWLIACDQMNDFNSYFCQHNPSTLASRFSPEARKQKKIEKFQLMKSLKVSNQQQMGQNDHQHPHHTNTKSFQKLYF